MSADTPPTDNNPTPGMGRPPVPTQAVSAPPPPPPGYLPPAYPAPPKPKGVISKVVTSLVATLFIVSILVNVYAFIIIKSLAAGASEVSYREGTGDRRIVIVPVVGTIDDDMAEYVRKSFKALDKKPPAAIVLRVESGGGGVTASDEIWHTITQYKKRNPDVKIVSSFGGVAASGGYYIATPSDYIVCQHTGITGSIGVVAQIPSVQGMVDLLGIEMNTVLADGSDRKAVANNLFENWKNDDGKLTDGGVENEAVLKNLLNDAWGRFVEVVDKGRPTLSTQQVRALATGDIYTAEQALENQLIDEVGYLDDAIDKAIEMAGLGPGADPNVTVIRQGGGGLLGILGAQSRNNVGLNDLSPDTVRAWAEGLGEVRLSYRVPFR